MKKFLTIWVLSILLACNDAGDNKAKNVVEDRHEKHAGDKTLQLNNGKKWQADSSTNNNVSNLQAVIQQFYNNNNLSLPAYKITGGELQAGLDKMVRECRMKGPDHDALHLWLVPLMQQVKDLNKAATTEEANLIFTGIDQHINQYNQFFQ
jgi:hypothetical protein